MFNFAGAPPNEFALSLLFHQGQMVVFKQDVCPAEMPC